MRPLHSYRYVRDVPSSRQGGSFLIKVVLVTLATAGILAVVVPRYTSAEKIGRELTVKGFLRTVAAINKDYRAQNKKFADSLDSVTAHGKLQPLVEAVETTGYSFEYRGSRHEWSCTADPGLPGTAHFFIDQSGVIRFREDGTAGAGDAKVE